MEEDEVTEESRNVVVFRKRRRNKAVRMRKPSSFFIKYILAYFALQVIFTVGLFTNGYIVGQIQSSTSELEIRRPRIQSRTVCIS